MLRSFLIGLVAGQRAMAPLAVLAGAARRGALPHDNPAARLIGRPLPAAGAVAMAAAEMAGDKMKTAPDRVVPVGLVARAITGGFAGAALASRERQAAGALVGAATAVASSWLGWRARLWAMERWGQTATGFAEDAAVLAGAAATVR
jgi:uncharacterized membrane protein